MTTNNAEREKFLRDRKLGIGGSDVAAIMGLNPWTTPMQVYIDKVSPDIIVKDNPAIRAGIENEEKVLKKYSENNGVEIISKVIVVEDGVEIEKKLPTIKDKEFPFLIANLDAMTVDKSRVVEAKTTSSFSKTFANGLPQSYLYQVAHYCMIAEVDFADIAVLSLEDNKYTEYTYFRDYNLEDKIRKACVNFWENHVVKRVPPLPMNEDDVELLYPSSEPDSSIEATPKILNNYEVIKRANEEIKRLKKDIEELELSIEPYKASIMEELKEKELITLDGKRLITWKTSTTNRLDTTKLKEKAPSVYNEYLKTSTSRLFKIF